MQYPQGIPLLHGIDRAQPFTPSEAHAVADYGYRVVAYYLPSPYAAIVWRTADVQQIPIETSRYEPIYPLPIYVASLELSVGDGYRYGHEAMAYLRLYRNHDVVVLDIEEEAHSTQTPGVADIDMQEQVAREFIETFAGSGIVPVIYGSIELADRLKTNTWLANWIGHTLDDAGTGLLSYLNGYRPLGWQYAGNVPDAYNTLVVDLSVWSPYLFTKAYKLLGENVPTYITKEGDTLASISTELYGNENSVQDLYNFNVRSLTTYGGGGRPLPAGIVLSVPGAEVAANEPTTDAQAPASTEASQDEKATVEAPTDAGAAEKISVAIPAPKPPLSVAITKLRNLADELEGGFYQ